MYLPVNVLFSVVFCYYVFLSSSSCSFASCHSCPIYNFKVNSIGFSHIHASLFSLLSLPVFIFPIVSLFIYLLFSAFSMSCFLFLLLYFSSIASPLFDLRRFCLSMCSFVSCSISLSPPSISLTFSLAIFVVSYCFVSVTYLFL